MKKHMSSSISSEAEEETASGDHTQMLLMQEQVVAHDVVVLRKWMVWEERSVSFLDLLDEKIFPTSGGPLQD